MAADQQQLYQAALLAHHKNPVGFNLEFDSDYQLDGYNSACGDEISISIKVAEKVITQVAFSGESCAICRASASILCQEVEKVTIADYAKLSAQLEICLSGQENFAEIFLPLTSIAKYPVRQQCALLPWQTLDKLIATQKELT